MGRREPAHDVHLHVLRAADLGDGFQEGARMHAEARAPHQTSGEPERAHQVGQ